MGTKELKGDNERPRDENELKNCRETE